MFRYSGSEGLLGPLRAIWFASPRAPIFGRTGVMRLSSARVVSALDFRPIHQRSFSKRGNGPQLKCQTKPALSRRVRMAQPVVSPTTATKHGNSPRSIPTGRLNPAASRPRSTRVPTTPPVCERPPAPPLIFHRGGTGRQKNPWFIGLSSAPPCGSTPATQARSPDSFSSTGTEVGREPWVVHRGAPRRQVVRPYPRQNHQGGRPDDPAPGHIDSFQQFHQTTNAAGAHPKTADKTPQPNLGSVAETRTNGAQPLARLDEPRHPTTKGGDRPRITPATGTSTSSRTGLTTLANQNARRGSTARALSDGAQPTLVANRHTLSSAEIGRDHQPRDRRTCVQAPPETRGASRP